MPIVVGVPRRGFLKKGVLGGVLLLGAGSVPIALRRTKVRTPPQGELRLLSREEHAIFAAVAARVVPGDGAPPAWPTAEALDCAGKADQLLARCHPEVGKEFKQLLALFENGLVALVTTGRPTPFTRLGAKEQDARLDAWRRSRVSVLRTGYQALSRLAHATYFASPEVYALVGYPGPPMVPGGAR